MIRTNVVKLTVLPAFAYREKRKDGGSSVVILRKGASQPGIAGVDKRTGKAIPTANTNNGLYPAEAFEEALKLTYGMPYRKQKSVKIADDMFTEVKEEIPEAEDVVVDSADYQRIVDHYTDKDGRLSYDLINKELIRFAHSSSIVRGMIEDRKSAAKIRDYIVANKFRNIAGNDDLTNGQIDKIVELLDEVSPKGVFKELNAEIRKLLKGTKKA
ncbi:MAG: hypothetical protein IKF51_06135 [Solobacterium sp.]|nr:hypothetical protein [Solobacterium sp.]